MDFNLCPISDWSRWAFSANSIQCYFDKSQQSNGYRQGSWFVKGGFMISTVVVPTVGEGALRQLASSQPCTFEML